MSQEFTYKITFFPGTEKFILKEFKEKYPEEKILSEDSKEVVFSSHISDIETFRNLYSPTYIETETKKINLFRREWKKESVSAGINPSLAYILCFVAGCTQGEILCDPFCGASTIPITALKYFNIKRVLCSDVSGNAVDKSLINFSSAGISSNKFKIFRNDIDNVKFRKQNVDKIISNLPFGIRVGSHEGNVKAYESFEKMSSNILRKKGLIVVLTQEKVLLRKVFKKEKWKIKSIIRINEGGLFPEVFLISRR